MKDVSNLHSVECAEINDKSIFKVLRFLVFEICTQYSQFSMNFHDNKKIKIGNLIFHSIQHCAHIS